MRIIGGKLSGSRFEPPKNIPTRPTTDMAKQGLFNMLDNNYNFENLKVLDLFAVRAVYRTSLHRVAARI
jgi:16S rRNA G966 N2-methylase RsmD